jgi:hypothetical protein
MECKSFVKPDDLLIVVSAHPGYISYLSILDDIPIRLENNFPNYNRVVIYPQQYTPEHLLDDEHPIFTPV